MWDKFWFASIDARQYAALRIAFGGLSALYFVELLPYLQIHFSSMGWLGQVRRIAGQNGGSWSLFFIDAGDWAAMPAYAIMMTGIAAALLLMIGWHSRLAAAVTWLVWVSLWNRNPLLLDGDDAVLKLMCFYLMLSPSGNCWSADACCRKMPERVAVWPLRLMQFQIALLYYVSGWVKFHSPEWLDGTVLNYVLIHPHYARWNAWQIIGEPITQVILTGLADFIRWWELLFPFLLINACIRKVSLLIGILFHTGLLLTLHLRWFPLIMLSLYPAFAANGSFLGLEKNLLKVCCFRDKRA